MEQNHYASHKQVLKGLNQIIYSANIDMTPELRLKVSSWRLPTWQQ